jgi:hypothetical protein
MEMRKKIVSSQNYYTKFCFRKLKNNYVQKERPKMSKVSNMNTNVASTVRIFVNMVRVNSNFVSQLLGYTGGLEVFN